MHFLKSHFIVCMMLIYLIKYGSLINSKKHERLNFRRKIFNQCRKSPGNATLSDTNVQLDLGTDGVTGRCQGGLLHGLLRMINVCGVSTMCYRTRMLVALDRVLASDSLQLADGVYLVKEDYHGERLVTGVSESEPFLTAVARRVVTLLETHALRVRLGVMKSVSQARGFHRGYRHAFPMMVGSFMLLAAVTVPMGFQFLAVIGGKALILSQIALFLALGGQLQRYLGWGGGPPAPAGGFVQHDYFLRDDLRPWHREGVDDVTSVTSPQHASQLSNQQLQNYLNQRA